MTATARPGLVVYQNTGGVDAIDEYSRRLVDALVANGTTVEYVADGLSAARQRDAEPAWVLLQYNPFSYGRWGVAPALLRDAAAVRRRWSATFAVCVHEPWTHVHDWRSALMAACQRGQLPVLLTLADVVLGVTERTARRLGRDAIHVPVGSNVTPAEMTTRAARERIGVTGKLVVALFGTGHPSRAIDHAQGAIAALANRRGADSICVLNLGLGAPPLQVPTGVVVHTPGRIEARELSLQLRASDIVLLPFVDGISTRRTTLMAALAHGLPVVSVRGTDTDSVLVTHPDAISLTPVGELAAYARAVVELVEDQSQLRAVGLAGRRLYEERFDWPVLADQVKAAMQPAARAR